MLTLGLDFGTTSVSAAAVRADGSLAGRLSRNHAADIAGLPAGQAEQSPRKLLETAIGLLAELTGSLSEPVQCLGLTGQMHGLILVDGALNPVSNLISWQDKRSLAVAGQEETYLDRFRRLCPQDAIARTGCKPSPGYLGVTLFTLARQNALPSDAAAALIFADWIAAALTGNAPATDPTNAASTGMYDLERQCWSEEMIAATGLPRHLLPRVVNSGSVLGGLRPEFASRLGLPSGLPVCAAIGDHQAAVLGSLPAGENALQINIGTGGQISIPVPQFLRTPGSDTRYLPDNRYLIVGAGFAGGNAIAWVRETAATWTGAFGTAEQPPEELYRTLVRLAEQVPPGCDGLTCEPFFNGTRQDPCRRGVFKGIDPHNFTPGHLYRATLEGIAWAFAEFAARQQRETPLAARPFTRITATGNAVRRNRLLAESLSAAFGLPLFVTEQQEEAAFGAAILAGVRCGVWSDLNQAGRGFRLIPAGKIADKA